jgi:hypothetical protein
MKRNMTVMSLVAASLIAGTAGAYAATYPTGQADEWKPGPPAAAAPAQAYDYYGRYAWNERPNGSNHPTPESTQGDVGPGGNNNGTVTGVYRYR